MPEVEQTPTSTQAARVNRFVLQKLNETEFTCPKWKCTDNFKYENARRHHNECEFRTMICLLKCGSAAEIRGLKNMRAHLENECKSTILKCIFCEEK